MDTRRALNLQITESEIKGRFGIFFRLTVAVVILAAASFLVYFAMWNGDYYGSGNDIWGHYFKTEIMYQSIKEGNFYPLYAPDWYNGIQLYRYWAPLSYYVLAGLRFLVGGSMESAYYLFFALSAFLGGLPWIIMGSKVNRTFLGTAFAVLWFFMPDNIRVFLNEGNLPRMITIVLIPYLILFLWSYIRQQKRGACIGLIVVMALMVLAHVMIAAMSGVAVFLFLAFDGIRNKRYLTALRTLLAMIAGIMISGIWLIPALSGGLVSMNSSSTATVLASLAYELSAQLNPLLRLSDTGPFYFGLATFCISLLGLIFARKHQKAGYLFTLCLVVAITPAFLPILAQFPASELFWMIRFTTFAYAFFFFSFLEWNILRRWAVIAIVAILALDCLPSLKFERYFVDHSQNASEDMKIIKEITNQRVALLDLSISGSYPAWEICTGPDKVQYTYGWAWQGAETAENIVLLNTALETENYLYLFDRSLEMGNDTVAIRSENIGKNDKTVSDMMHGAAVSGYKLVAQTDKLYIFHKETPETFGLITDYEGIAIGMYANTVPLYYPSFVTGTSYYLDDYKVSDFDGYDTLFLSGFTYHSKADAEALVLEIAEQGVRVIIDVTHVPFDSSTRRMNFLEVSVSDVSFTTHYPDMHYKNSTILSGYFSKEYETWRTQYLTNIKNIVGYVDYSGEKLTWAGYNDNENIIFLGFNLMFHAIDSEDSEVFTLISDIFEVDYQKLPFRELVPIVVEYTNKGILITSSKDNVNTTLAMQDIFISDRKLMAQNNLLIVNKGTTKIEFEYPLAKEGRNMSIAGLIFSIMLCWQDFTAKKRKLKAEMKKTD